MDLKNLTIDFDGIRITKLQNLEVARANHSDPENYPANAEIAKLQDELEPIIQERKAEFEAAENPPPAEVPTEVDAETKTRIEQEERYEADLRTHRELAAEKIAHKNAKAALTALEETPIDFPAEIMDQARKDVSDSGINILKLTAALGAKVPDGIDAEVARAAEAATEAPEVEATK